MGGTSSVVVGDTKIDLNNYTCSDRGLILPCNNITSKKIKIKINLFFLFNQVISEYTWPIWIRTIIYLLLLLYLFLGIGNV